MLKKKQELSNGEKGIGFNTKRMGSVECVVCLTEEQNGILLDCGHAYCQVRKVKLIAYTASTVNFVYHSIEKIRIFSSGNVR